MPASHPIPSTGAVMTPIYATSTYVQESPGEHKGYEYSRSQNPTRMAYERCVADLESGSAGYAFASGLAATATILELLDSGDHVVAMDDLYGGSRRLFDRVRERSAGLDFSFVDLTDLAAFEAAIRPETRMIWVETPTNPLLKLVDLAALAAAGAQARHHHRLRQHLRQPLCAAAHRAWLRHRHAFRDQVPERPFRHGGRRAGGGRERRSRGSASPSCRTPSAPSPGPFDSFLALRGLKTLALRMERHCSNAMAVARFLEKHPRVERVFYPGLPSHPQHALAKRQMHGFGGMVTAVLKGSLDEPAASSNAARSSPSPRASAASRA